LSERVSARLGRPADIWDVRLDRISSAEAIASGSRKATIVPADAGLSVENPVGGVLTFKAMSNETGGAVTALETVAATGEGPPLHVHEEDELIRTLEGVFRIKFGEMVQELAAGSFVFIPGGIPHTWQNIGSRPARFFATIMPGAKAFEEFFRRYGELPADQRGVEAFNRLATETKAFQVLGPPLAESDPV
jgi:quercetin dioxygenase-like cupin family protein